MKFLNMFARFCGVVSVFLAIASCDFRSPFATSNATPSLRLKGALVSPEGMPVSGVWVKAFAASSPLTAKLTTGTDVGAALALDSSLTGENGVFQLSGLGKGTYNLVASMQRNDTTLAIFQRGVEVNGNIYLGIDTLRPTGTIVQAVDRGPGAQCVIAGSPYATVSDSLGDCTLEGIPPGTFQVTVTYPAYERQTTGEIVVASGMSSFPATIQMKMIRQGPDYQLTSSTVALWTFNENFMSYSTPDIGPNSLNLGLGEESAPILFVTSPHGMAAYLWQYGHTLRTAKNDTLTLSGTGRLTFEARVFLSGYPENWNIEASHIVGLKEGLKLMIHSNGSLEAMAQVWNGTSWSWYPAKGAPGTVPLNRWVNLAVAVDQTQRQLYGYVDSVAIQLYRPDTVPFTQIRAGVTPFTVGGRTQPFVGQIDDIRISNDLVLGEGLPLRDTVMSPVQYSPGPGGAARYVAVGLTWGSVRSALRYRLQIAKDSIFTLKALDTTLIDTTDTLALEQGTVYYWRVRAEYANGEGSYSPAHKFTTTSWAEDVGLSPPVLFTPADSATEVPTSSLFSWSKVYPSFKSNWRVSSYQLQIAIDPNFTSMTCNETGILDTTRTVDSLAAGTVYYWRARGLALDGGGQWSPTARFKTAVGTGEPH